MSEAHQKRPTLSMWERVLRLRRRMYSLEDASLPGDEAIPASLWGKPAGIDKPAVQDVLLIKWNTYDDFTEWDKRI